jgi:hypothetical protein
MKAVEVATRIGDRKTAERRLRQAYAVDPKAPSVLMRLGEFGLADDPATALPPTP